MAYNAEKTLKLTADSIVAQSYQNWLWYIVDNGSTDSTGKMIHQLAKKDSRIVPLTNNNNQKWEPGNKIIEIIDKYDDSDCICWIDADDAYKPDFLKTMMNYMVAERLDIVACGNDFIDATTNTCSTVRVSNQNFIISGDGFSRYFRQYYQFMRTYWAKLFSVGILRHYDSANAPFVTYGWDTLFTEELFRNASRVGILDKSLYKYYLYPKSLSHRFNNKRIESDQILFHLTSGFLVSKCGYVSKQNEKFLSDVYFCSLKDTFNVIVGSQMEPIEKMRNIFDMFTNETTVGQLENGYGSGDTFKSLRSTVFKWLLAQTACRRSEGAKLAGQIIASLYGELTQFISTEGLCFYVQKMPEIIAFLVNKDYEKALERIHIYYKRHDKDEPALAELEIALYRVLNKTDSEFFSLLTDIKKNRRKCSEALNVDAEISTIIGKYPLLNGLNVDLAVLFSHSVQYIMEGDYGKALNAFLNICDVEINDDDAEKYIMFGQNLSAAAQNSNSYIYFKKIWISYLIDHSKKEVAVKELNEFLKVLPNDKDFLNFKKQIG